MNVGLLIFIAILLVVGNEVLAQNFELKSLRPPFADSSKFRKKVRKGNLSNLLINPEFSLTSVYTNRKGINLISPVLRYSELSGSTSISTGVVPIKIQASYVLGDLPQPKPQLYLNVSFDSELANRKYREQFERSKKDSRERLTSLYGKKESALAIQLEKSGALGGLEHEALMVDTPVLPVSPEDTSGLGKTLLFPGNTDLPNGFDVGGNSVPSKALGVDSSHMDESMSPLSIQQKRDSIAGSYPGRETEISGMFSEIDSLKKNNPDFLRDIKSYLKSSHYADSAINAKAPLARPIPKLGTFYSSWSEHSIYQKAFCGLNYKFETVHSTVEFIVSANPFPGLARTNRFNKAALVNIGLNSKLFALSLRSGFVSNNENNGDTTISKVRIYGIRSFDTYLLGSTQVVRISPRLEYHSEWNRVTSSANRLSSKQVFDGFFQRGPIGTYNGDAIAQTIKFYSRYFKFDVGYSRVSPKFLNAGNPYLRFNWEKLSAGVTIHSSNKKAFVEPRIELGRRLLDTGKPYLKNLLMAVCTFGYTETNGGISGSISRPFANKDSLGVEKAIQFNVQCWWKNYAGSWVVQTILHGRSGNRNVVLERTVSTIHSTSCGAVAQFNKGEVALTSKTEFSADQLTADIRLHVLNIQQVFEAPIIKSFLIKAFLQENIYLNSGLGTIVGANFQKKFNREYFVDFGFRLASESNRLEKIPIKYSENQIFIKIIWRK